MKFEKIALLLVLGGIGAQAFAADETAQVEAYNSASQLDIAHVVSISDTANQCGAVPCYVFPEQLNSVWLMRSSSWIIETPMAL